MKWWHLHECKAQLTAGLGMIDVDADQQAITIWEDAASQIHQVVRNVPSEARPGKKFIDKQIWWWNEEVNLDDQYHGANMEGQRRCSGVLQLPANLPPLPCDEDVGDGLRHEARQDYQYYAKPEWLCEGMWNDGRHPCCQAVHGEAPEEQASPCGLSGPGNGVGPDPHEVIWQAL
uniref:Uncharacterized protein n=1 Tax=Romanomermis culicivorax TaxID=13658 RepID=A0A915I203_ROMCU